MKAAARMNRLLQHLRTTLPEPDGGGPIDGQLLDSYIAHRDEASFAALVRRHGPMVWGVCRRLLSVHQDAEDAFQATFLVLVRKATAVVPRSMVGNWLHGVAHHTALKARAMTARRSVREGQVIDMPDRETTLADSWSDLQPVLDQELTRLPERYRAVVLLCDLEGKTRKEAARQLGVPEGTVAGWLSRARAMLAKRLGRRGVLLSGGSLAAMLVEYGAPANVPAAVAASTIQAATLFAAGHVAAGVISTPVVALTEGVLKTMLLKKLKIALVVLLATGIVGTGVTGLAFQASAGDDPKAKPPVEKKAGKLIAEPTGADADLRQLKAEIEKLRAEVDSLKKQARSADSPPASDANPVKLSLKVYSVKDLVREINPADGPRAAGGPRPSIVQIIINIVQPQSWSQQGGQGSVEYFDIGQSLVISQSAEVHKEIEILLTELRSALPKEDVPRKK
jgi:RNA polymerase sigma factor (sigma-70 family)